MAIGKAVTSLWEKGSTLDSSIGDVLRNMKPNETRGWVWEPDAKTAEMMKPYQDRIEKAQAFLKATRAGHLSNGKPFAPDKNTVARVTEDLEEAMNGPVGSVAKDDGLNKIITSAINTDRTRFQNRVNDLARKLKGISFKVEQAGVGLDRQFQVTCIRIDPVKDVVAGIYEDLDEETRELLGIVLPTVEQEPEATDAEKAAQAELDALEEATKPSA